MDTHNRTFVIGNEHGLHARRAAQLAKTASAFEAEILVSRDGSSADGKSILSLMMLGAAKGTPLTVSATGPDAADALYVLAALFYTCFAAECPAGQECEECLMRRSTEIGASPP
jgi:phosphocarrier protein